MGFGDSPSGLSNLFLDFLLKLLGAAEIGTQKEAGVRNTHVCQLGTYRDQPGQEYRVFYVPEQVYRAITELRYELRDNLESYRANAETKGFNFLIQQLRQDVLGTAAQ